MNQAHWKQTKHHSRDFTYGVISFHWKDVLYSSCSHTGGEHGNMNICVFYYEYYNAIFDSTVLEKGRRLYTKACTSRQLRISNNYSSIQDPLNYILNAYTLEVDRLFGFAD